VVIIADYREPKAFREKADRVIKLPCDYIIGASDQIIRVERKTWTDLYNSVVSGRFNNQVQHVDEVIVVSNSFVPYDVYKIITSQRMIDIINGIETHHVLKFAMDIEHFFRILRRIENKLKKREYRIIRVPPTYHEQADCLQVQALAVVLGGKSVGRAKEVLKVYKTLENALANIDNWHKDVKGIGKKTVEKAIKIYREKLLPEEGTGRLVPADASFKQTHAGK